MNPSPSGRRTRRSRRARAAPARACGARTRRRPSSARPPRGGRGRAASRRPSRSSAGTRPARPCPRRTSWTIFPGSASVVGIVLVRLERGERDKRVARELGAEEERLQARDQRVAPEHGHEPRHARGEELAVGAPPRRGGARRGRRPSGRTRRRAACQVARSWGTRIRQARQRRADALELLAEVALGAGPGALRARRGRRARRPGAASARPARARCGSGSCAPSTSPGCGEDELRDAGRARRDRRGAAGRRRRSRGATRARAAAARARGSPSEKSCP